jgi:hypothetical protein
MHFQSVAHVVVLMTATLTSGIHVPGYLPDGLWTGQQLPNGTTITTSLSDPTLPPIIEHHEIIPRRSIDERGSGTGACWGYFLDPASVDADNAALQAYVDTVGDRLCSGSHNQYWGEIVNSVIVYFCADQSHEWWTVFSSAVQTGMASMGAICAPYEAGWALVPNSSERGLFGKCVINSQICE